MLQIDSNIWRAGYGVMVSSFIQFEVDEMRSPSAVSGRKGEYPLNTIHFSLMGHRGGDDIASFASQVLSDPSVKKIFTMDLERHASLVLEFQSDSMELQVLLQYGHYVKPFTNLQ